VTGAARCVPDPLGHNAIVRRYHLLFAALVPSLVVGFMLVQVTTSRERVRRSEESVLDAQLAALDAAVKRMQNELDGVVQQSESEKRRHQSDEEAMRSQLESLRNELLKANQHVALLQADLDQARAPAVTPAAPTEPGHDTVR